MRSLSIVLPCYNEQAIIAETVRDVAGWMSSRNFLGEIIVVDDRSTDGSSSIIHKLSKEYPFLKLIQHEKNKGYGPTVKAGLDAAQSDLVAFMDSDGQFRVTDFDLLLPYIDTHRLVSGCREQRADPFLRRVLGKLLWSINRLLFGIQVTDVNCGLKVFERSLWRTIRPSAELDKFFNTALFINLRVHAVRWQMVPVPHFRRNSGIPNGANGTVILGMIREIYTLLFTDVGS